MAATKGAGNVTVTWNSTNITAYCDTAGFTATFAELDTTNLASTGMAFIPGLGDFTIEINPKLWDATIDGILMADMLSGTARAVSLNFDDGTNDVTYAWASAYVMGGGVSSNATEMIGITGLSIRCNGAPTRTPA